MINHHIENESQQGDRCAFFAQLLLSAVRLSRNLHKTRGVFTTALRYTGGMELSDRIAAPENSPSQGKVVAQPPPHTETQSTLAPTSEFVRTLLLALPARYTLRATVDGLFSEEAPKLVREKMQRFIGKIWGNNADRKYANNVAYDYALGAGSLVVTSTYTNLVYQDIQNMFRETVGMEMDKPAAKVTFWDITRSDNRIVSRTLENFSFKTAERYGTDMLFFARPLKAFRWLPMGDLMIGVKASLALGDTWKRKTTVFEDLVAFVNHKVNPRNGLGQPISIGEVFDLYQHYSQTFAPERSFKNVVDSGSEEAALWADSQPIFQRLTELMNKTYAYKHNAVLTADGEQTVAQADFALPKLIYLLGHDLIDIRKPEETLVRIEIANQFGMRAVKDMQLMLQHGENLAAVTTRYPVVLVTPEAQKVEEKNGVIAKGSTMQVDAVLPLEPAALAPLPQIAARSVAEHQPLAMVGGLAVG